MPDEFYTVQICGLTRNLPLFEVAPNVRIAIFNMLGDTRWSRPSRTSWPAGCPQMRMR